MILAPVAMWILLVVAIMAAMLAVLSLGIQLIFKIDNDRYAKKVWGRGEKV
jgi:hypothetical protein